MSKLIPLLETLFMNKGANPQLWSATNDVILNKTDEGRNFCVFMKGKLRDMNQEVQLLALDFLDYSMDKGKMPLWTQAGSKDFLTSLIALLKTRDVPEVQSKILFLIDKWARKFEQYKEILPLYKDMYANLKNAGVVFPSNMHSTYCKYIDGQTSEESGLASNDDSPQQKQAVGVRVKFTKGNYDKIYERVGLDPSQFEKKYKKLVMKLMECIDSIVLSNELIDNGMVDHELTNITIELRRANTQLVDTISSDKLKDENLMEICLGIIEDVNKTLKRYDALKEGRLPDVYVSYFGGSEEIGMKHVGKEKEITNEKPLLDLFGGFDAQQQPHTHTQQQSQSNNVMSNDLFDIFSNQQSLGNNNQVGMNMQMSMQTMGNNSNNLNNTGISMDLFQNFSNNQNPNQIKNDMQTFNYPDLNTNTHMQNPSLNNNINMDLLLNNNKVESQPIFLPQSQIINQLLLQPNLQLHYDLHNNQNKELQSNYPFNLN